jgi:hypothetical protein
MSAACFLLFKGADAAALGSCDLKLVGRQTAGHIYCRWRFQFDVRKWELIVRETGWSGLG